jgi:protein-S-isoprenylcysteine O-methyltransferase Ste14
LTLPDEARERQHAQRAPEAQARSAGVAARAAAEALAMGGAGMSVVTRMKHRRTLDLRGLVESGDKIGLFALPFLVVGLILNIAYPSAFNVGGPGTVLRVISIILLVLGVAIWIWSVALIVTKVPRGELITHGPYALVKHPLYTGVALLVLPWIGFLLNTWLGALVGMALYIGSRVFAPAEEAELAKTFGAAWDEYSHTVKVPWL